MALYNLWCAHYIVTFAVFLPQEVVERLDESTKRILQVNRKLEADLKLHVTETEELTKIKKKVRSRVLKRLA